MACAGAKAVGILKFVGTVSLGLLTGVSYSVSALSLPNLLELSSSASASRAVRSLRNRLRVPVHALTALASAPLLLSFVLSPRSARHPYLLYTSLLAMLSTAAPRLLNGQASLRGGATTTNAAASSSTASGKRAAAVPRRRMDSSYEVLGDSASDPASEEDSDDLNGEEVRAEVQSLARGFVVRTGAAALGFVMAVVGIWGDGAPHLPPVYVA